MKNKEFLFIYEAANCNPNGDPDQENKPRMDWLTKTNLVSDARLKRYIRDYLIDKGECVFVSTVGGQKVSVPDRLKGFLNKLEDGCENKTGEEYFNELLGFEKEIGIEEDLESFFKKVKTDQTKKEKDSQKEKDKKDEKVDKLSNYELFKKREEKGYEKINNRILMALTRKEFLDIRYFGGAFAVDKFSLTITGPIQINMGYSLHPVELNSSDGLVTIMGTHEDQSGMGKKPGVLYSLIAFTGTINSKRAEIVKLTENEKKDENERKNNEDNSDMGIFREAIINCVRDFRSDSKKNQFPKLYLEIEYIKDETYGRLGDLRNLIDVKCKTKNEKGEPDFSKVRRLNELEISFDRLFSDLSKIKDKICKIRIWKSFDFDFDEEKILGDDKNNVKSKVEILTI